MIKEYALGIAAFLLTVATLSAIAALTLVIGVPLGLIAAVTVYPLRKRFDLCERIVDHVKQVFTAVDQLANAGLLGHADETISSRAGRSARRARAAGRRPAALTLFVWKWTDLFDPGHILKNIEEAALERERRGQPWK